MSNSVSNQTLAAIDLWKNKETYKAGVYRLSKKLDEEVARLHALQNGIAEASGLNASPDAKDRAPEPDAGTTYTKIDELLCAPDNTENLSLVLSLTKLYVASPLGSVYLVR